MPSETQHPQMPSETQHAREWADVVEAEGWPGPPEEPVRDSVNEALESLGRVLDRAGMTFDKVCAGLVARSPVIVLAGAAAVGLAIGIALSRRR